MKVEIIKHCKVFVGDEEFRMEFRICTAKWDTGVCTSVYLNENEYMDVDDGTCSEIDEIERLAIECISALVNREKRYTELRRKLRNAGRIRVCRAERAIHIWRKDGERI